LSGKRMFCHPIRVAPHGRLRIYGNRPVWVAAYEGFTATGQALHRIERLQAIGRPD
jgi:hypothetical protein